jgi:hypothetical protein
MERTHERKGNPMTASLLRAQIQALELMYSRERRCENARRILDLLHEKRDLLAVVSR